MQREDGSRRHAKEEQTATIRSVEQKKSGDGPAEAAAEDDKVGGKNRVRRLELWMGATFESIEMLLDIYNRLIPKLVHDLEVQAGLEVMKRITTDILDKFTPLMDKYHGSRQYGRKVAERLRTALFADAEKSSDPYEALAALQSLQLFMTYIEGHIIALSPSSQALWDAEFIEAVTFAQTSMSRQMSWVKQHIKVKAPQTLLVPTAWKGDLESDESSLAGRLRC